MNKPESPPVAPRPTVPFIKKASEDDAEPKAPPERFETLNSPFDGL